MENIAYALLIMARVILGVLLMVLASDHFAALDAPSCFVERGAQNCYPWGMGEGPMEGGSWSYANKEVYIAMGKALLWIIGTAFAASFLFRRPSFRLGVLILGCVVCAILVRPGSLLFPQDWLDAAEKRYQVDIKAAREPELAPTRAAP